MRVSFFGGGSDYPEVFQQLGGGRTLVGAINRYCTITVRWLPPFFEHHSRVSWSEIELVKDNLEIRNPVVREALCFLGIKEGVDIYYEGDMPARAGLGTSSAFTVGLLNALYNLQGIPVTRARLAKDAIRVERDYIGDTVGFQDQIAVASGWLNLVDISADGETRVVSCGGNMLDCGEQALRDLAGHLLLLYVGGQRIASEVAKDQVALAAGKVRTYERMNAMTLEGVEAFEALEFDRIGELLEEAWQLKRTLSPDISDGRLDSIHDEIIARGATGAKLLGAGAGGFFLAYYKDGEVLSRLCSVPGVVPIQFAFEPTGSRIIFKE